DVYSENIPAHRRLPAQEQQQIEQRIGVLAARDADHDAVVLVEKREISDGGAHLLDDLLFELGGETKGPQLGGSKRRRRQSRWRGRDLAEQGHPLHGTLSIAK